MRPGWERSETQGCLSLWLPERDWRSYHRKCHWHSAKTPLCAHRSSSRHPFTNKCPQLPIWAFTKRKERGKECNPPDIDDGDIVGSAFEREELRPCYVGDATSHIWWLLRLRLLLVSAKAQPGVGIGCSLGATHLQHKSPSLIYTTYDLRVLSSVLHDSRAKRGEVEGKWQVFRGFKANIIFFYFGFLF